MTSDVNLSAMDPVEIDAQYEALRNYARSKSAELAECYQTVDRLNKRIMQLESEIVVLKNSTTWRIGRVFIGPLSALLTIVRRK